MIDAQTGAEPRTVRQGEPRLTVVSGPSGVGKSSVLSEVRRRAPEVYFSVSATTRAPRAGEIDGLHYHFVGTADGGPQEGRATLRPVEKLLTVALARGQIKARGPVAKILKLVPLTKPLFPVYRDLIAQKDGEA